jgi:hypothetical protein
LTALPMIPMNQKENPKMEDDLEMQTPPGTIGLCPAGQRLDLYIAAHQPEYRSQLLRFIKHFSRLNKQLHESVGHWNDDDLTYMLKLLKDDFMKKAEERFKHQMDDYAYTTLCIYIGTLSKPNYVPNTKTQVRLRQTQQYERFLLDC